MFKVDGSTVWKVHTHHMLLRHCNAHILPTAAAPQSKGCTISHHAILGSWDWIPLRGNGCISTFFVSVLSYVHRGLGMGQSPIQRILPNVYEDSKTQKTEKPWNTLAWHAIQEEETC